MLELHDAVKGFRLPDQDVVTILDRASVEIAEGDIVAVLGRSGCGKSTLLHLIGLLDSLDGGSYRVDGRDVSNLTDREASALRGRTFGFLFQEFHLLERRSALQNVMAPLYHAPWTELSHGRDRAVALLDAVGLAGRRDSGPSQLSGGEQQRVAIARSLVRHPRYLLADEPTGSLDRETAAQILKLLIRLVDSEGCALLIVTHDDRVASVAGRQLLLEGGILRDRA